MLFFVCVFFPPVLSVLLFEKITKTALSAKHWAYMYAFSGALGNLISVFLIKWVTHLYVLDVESINFLIDYLIFSLAAACLIPIFTALLKKHIQIWVDGNETKVG